MSNAVLLVFACAVTFTTAEGTRIHLYAPYLAQYGYGMPAIGALSSLIGVFRLISRVPVGMAYRPGRAKTQLALSFTAFGLATGGYALVQGDLIAVVLLTVVHGFAFGSLGTLSLAVVIDLIGGKRVGVMMGWYTAALSSGFALGAFVGGWLGDTVGTSSALSIIGILPLTAALAILTLPTPPGSPQTVQRHKGFGGLLSAAARLDARVWLAFTIGVYVNMLFDTIESFFPLFGLTVGVPLALSGVLKGLKSGAATFIRFVSGAIFFYLDYRATTVWAVILGAAATFMLPNVRTVAAFAALFILAGLMRGILRVTSAAMVADIRDERHDVGLAAGVYNAGLDIGGIVGPALAGVLGNVVGLPAMFEIIAVASLAGYFTVALSTRAGRSSLRAGLQEPLRRP